MATTYARLKTVLIQAQKQKTWESAENLAAEIRRRKLAPFRMKRDAKAVEDYMKTASIEKLIGIGAELGLVSVAADTGQVSLTDAGAKSLKSEDAFELRIRSSVKSFLQKRHLPLNKIIDLIGDVRLPLVPDAETLHTRAQKLKPTPDIDQDLLRMMLFLLACAKGLKRNVRVHYSGT